MDFTVFSELLNIYCAQSVDGCSYWMFNSAIDIECWFKIYTGYQTNCQIALYAFTHLLHSDFFVSYNQSVPIK